MTIETQFDADAIRSAERARVSEITSLAKRFDADEVATQFIADGRSIDEFRAAVLDTMSKAPAVRATATVGLSDKEAQEYSFGRAIEALVSGDFSNAGYELECSRAAAKAQGKLQTRSNLFVPAEVLTRAAGTNAVTAAGNPSLVNRTKVGFMDVLFNNTIAQRLGVQYMSGNLNGVIELPKFTSAVQARFVDEGEDGTIDAITSGVGGPRQRRPPALGPARCGTAAWRPRTDAFNASTEGLSVQIDTSGWSPGRHLVYLSQTSEASGAAGAITTTFVDIEVATTLFGDGFE